MMPGLFTQPQQAPNLGEANMAHLMALSQQGNPTLSHGALVEQATSQAAMQEMAQKENIEVPKVNFYPSRHPDPRKARKQDIKQAYRLLRPTKRHFLNPMRLFFQRKFRYAKDTGTCVVDGCDCAELIKIENLYTKICDEDTGKSLWEMYWQNPITQEPEAFVARENVTSGRKMRGTYCPEHLHLYHLLVKWEKEQEKMDEANPRRLRDRVKQGVSMVTVPVASVVKKDPTPPMLEKYEPFFAQLQKDANKTDGITIIHHTNQLTGLNDVTMVIFDLRIFQHELEMANTPTAAFQALMEQQLNANTQLQPLPPGDE
tara:strand:+ start:4573 stop:5520 length:948 start_codon:yes stop_codon:yes gene_type:complete